MPYYTRIIDNYGVFRRYTDNKYKMVCLRSIKLGKYAKDFTAKGEAGNDNKLQNSISRTRERIRELAMCNEWQWFVTLTLDKNKYDRRNLNVFISDLAQFIRDYRKKTGCNVRYLLVPEQHKDGCWHMHGFIMGLPENELHKFSKGEHLPISIIKEMKQGKEVYTWKAYERKFGYASFERIVNNDCASSYITKYITKDTMKSVKDLNSHCFYASKGLNSAQLLMQDALKHELINPDYKNEYCAVKWYDDMNQGLSEFVGR